MHKITYDFNGTTYQFEVDEGTSILEGALQNGIDLPHDCKLGVCLTCPSKIISGESSQEGTLEDSVAKKGYALTCCLFARSDMEIRSIDEDELVQAQFEKF